MHESHRVSALKKLRDPVWSSRRVPAAQESAEMTIHYTLSLHVHTRLQLLATCHRHPREVLLN